MTNTIEAASKPDDGKLKTFRCRVTRELAQRQDIEVEAVDEDEARAFAEDQLCDDEWEDDGLTQDPEVTRIIEIRDEDEAETGAEAEAFRAAFDASLAYAGDRSLKPEFERAIARLAEAGN